VSWTAIEGVLPSCRADASTDHPCFVIVTYGVRQTVLACAKRIHFDKKHMARGLPAAL
jgi:hypothetical protein